MTMKSYLEVVSKCDNFPYFESENFEGNREQLASIWRFYLPDDPRPHGFLVDSVVEKMPWTSDFKLVTQPRKEVHLLRCDTADWHVELNKAIDRLLEEARSKNVFPELCHKSDEYFPIVGSSVGVHIERSAFSMFGIIGRGVHLNAFVRTPSGLKFWVPQRSMKQSRYPGMLDNTVAGGVAACEMPFEALLREAAEEAAISAEVIRRDVRAVGSVTWFNISDEKTGGESGLMNPGVLYVYDLEVSPNTLFNPVGDDIQTFHLMDEPQIKNAIMFGNFKPSSALVLIDFFIRHGFITAENEKDYVEIVSRLHRKLPFPTHP